jgi:hypothetical protein
MEVEAHAFLTSVLDGHGERTVCPAALSTGGPRAGLEVVEKEKPLRLQ